MEGCETGGGCAETKLHLKLKANHNLCTTYCRHGPVVLRLSYILN